MRNNKFLIFILFFAFLFGQACQNENPLITPESENAKTTSIDKSNIVPGDLTPEETDGLIHMRLDEKLARDVYIYLGELYNQKIFLSIQESEQKHMDAIDNLLDKYLVEDPLEIDVIGVFPEDFPEFQELYDLYVSQGGTSVQEAIAVGIAIEELDIADLEALRLITDNPDILKVYDKLLAASQIHLSKFLMHVKTEITIELTNVLSL